MAKNYKASSGQNILLSSMIGGGPMWGTPLSFGIFGAFPQLASSVSFNIEIPYGVFAQLYAVDRAGNILSTQTLFSANSSLTDFEFVPVTINAPSGMWEFMVSYIASDTRDDPWLAIDDLRITPYSPNFDLKVGQPIVTQAQVTSSASGTPLQVTPGVPVQVTVPISGTGFNNPDNRQTSVTLKAGPYTLPSQIVSLEKMRLGQASAATFSVTFAPQDVGLQTITATIDPGNVLNESDPSNNTKTIQINVVPNLLLAADFPDLPDDPSYNQKLSGATQSMQVPLGAKFNLQLNQLDASGTPTELSSTYSMKSQNISPVISTEDGIPLFPNNVLVEDGDTVAGTQKVFEAFHLGTTTIQIVPTDPLFSSQIISVNVTVYDPGTIGKKEPTPDDLIVKYAHRRGVLPQVIKALISHEGFVQEVGAIRADAFRYEPRWDKTFIQSANANHPIAILNDPEYMPDELKKDGSDDSIRQTHLWQADIDPRDVYNMTDPITEVNPSPTPRPITPGDVGVTAANYIDSNQDYPSSWLTKYGPFNFTAQSTVASSYGYMQVIYIVALEEGWESPSGENHPSELFIPDENLWAGSKHLKKYIKSRYKKAHFDDTNPTGRKIDQINALISPALLDYNGGSDAKYDLKVLEHEPDYVPNLTLPVFMSGN